MTLLNKIVLIVFFSIAYQLSSAQQNLMDFDNSLKFARYLSTTRQLNFASQEYERLNYIWPNDSLVTFELVQTYRLNKQCEKIDYSFDLFSNQGRLFKNVDFTREYLRFSLTCKIEDKNYFNVISQLESEEKVFFTTSYFWINKKYDSLFNYYSKEKELLAHANINLHDVTKSFSEQKYKSPFLASLMSSVIPGSGKAYVNRWGDAFVSFLFVGTNSYASYRAFKKKGVNSVNGWIFGSLAVSFYSANIWGSAKAAKNYNNKQKEIYQLNAENIIYNSY
jgi:hypothetical protein